MLEVCCYANLAQEPVDADSGGEVRMEHLERDGAAMLEVVREIDGRHAAGAEFALNGVAAGEGGVESVDGGGHVSQECSGGGLHARWERNDDAHGHCLRRGTAIQIATVPHSPPGPFSSGGTDDDL